MSDKKNKILVAIDGSNQSWDLVHYISKVVSPQNTEVVLFHVMRTIKDAFQDVGANPDFHNKVANLSAWQSTHRIMIQKFMDEACQILKDEHEFNSGAGFTKTDDRLPDFFEEKLPPHNTVWDITNEELQQAKHFD